MIADRLIGIIAPFDCLSCGRQGEIVCTTCLPTIATAKRSGCYLCNRLTEQWQACSSCRRKTKLRGVIVASHYDGRVKELIRRLKYQRAVSAASVLALCTAVAKH